MPDVFEYNAWSPLAILYILVFDNPSHPNETLLFPVVFLYKAPIRCICTQYICSMQDLELVLLRKAYLAILY
jgi:hypothetical protein